MSRTWTIDTWEIRGRREVTLRDEHWTASLEIDSNGDLCVEHEVEIDCYGGGTHNVRCYVPMAKVIEWLREVGYDVAARSPVPGTDDPTNSSRGEP